MEKLARACEDLVTLDVNIAHEPNAYWTTFTDDVLGFVLSEPKLRELKLRTPLARSTHSLPYE